MGGAERSVGFLICGASCVIKLCGKEPPRHTALCDLEPGPMLMFCLYTINNYIGLLNDRYHWVLKIKSDWRKRNWLQGTVTFESLQGIETGWYIPLHPALCHAAHSFSNCGRVGW